MSLDHHDGSLQQEPLRARGPTSDEGAPTFLRRAAVFALIGAVLYGGVYVWAEQLVYQYARRNRFFMVKTAPHAEYDVVILGTSHAAVFDYDDMNAQLEALTGLRILNLSVVGAGVVVNKLVLDYFLASHRTHAVLYVVDSFGFNSREWNEVRVQDSALYTRAPFDPTLTRLLLTTPATRSVALPYLLGFSKINDADRFAPDVREEERSRFDRTYRPVKQIDQQRLDYLYPKVAVEDTATEARYLGIFEEVVADLKARGTRVVLIKPPVPARISAALPDEAAFDAKLQAIATRQGAEFHDYSAVNNDESLFFDSDHLNRTGVTQFFETYLAPLLRSTTAAAEPTAR